MNITYRISAKERAKLEVILAMHIRNRDCIGQTAYGVEYYTNKVNEVATILVSGKRTVPCNMPSAAFMARIAEGE